MIKFADEIELIKASGLFDSDWYLTQYADVARIRVDPVHHYLSLGAELFRNPSQLFDTRYYRQSNPDVMASGVNPLVHYITHGLREGRLPLPDPAVREQFAESIDVVVPVFNALSDVRHCLRSIESHNDGFTVRAIVVNDGSDTETTAWLRDFCATRAMFKLVEHERNKGYTQAVNTGLRATTAPYAITLNSDTIVTRGWLRGMVRCANSDRRLGIVGPLSNAASWQNVPDLYDEDGNFAVNALPADTSPDDMAHIVAKASSRVYPRTPFINGFCFLIKRAVIDAIGYMDELNFPVGYGEENDYCIRAADAGFSLAVADDVYVFHAKSKSFGHSKRKELSQQGSASIKRKHTAQKFEALVKEVKNTAALDTIRSAVKAELGRNLGPVVEPVPIMAMRILFLLPVRGGSGGAHSVVQEVSEMRRMGICANIGVKQDDVARFLEMYADIPNADELFVGFNEDSLLELAFEYDIAVGTIFTSMALIKRMVDANPGLLAAYYVQDYEPLFFPKGTKNWKIAHDSYTLIPGATLFAKTHWIVNEVFANHGVEVNKVEPSIDHVVYRPQARLKEGAIAIAAMIRPQTPRRGADRTMRLLARIARQHAGRVTIHLFGCEPDSEQFEALESNFPYVNYGVLKRPEVTALLGQADIFVDLSDYQAFGRTALEAMACGCTAMVPVHGGTDEYAIDGVNALVVDSFNEEECFHRLDELLKMPGKLAELKHAGLLTAAHYSVHAAAVSELVLFASALARHRKAHVPRTRRRLTLVPSLTRKKGSDPQFPTGSAHVRLLTPYLNPLVRRAWRVEVAAAGCLPVPGCADIALLQRDVNAVSLETLKSWVPEWRSAGGKIFLEIDDDLVDRQTLSGRTGVDNPEQLAAKVAWLAGQADRVIVSTPQLAQAIAPYNADIKVVPNYLDATLWKLDRPRDHTSGPYGRGFGSPVKIGYIGTPSHVEDVAVIEGAMQRLKRDYGDLVEIEVIGVFQSAPATFGVRVPLPKNNDYPNFVEWLHKRVHWDIGLIPLVDNKFNRSKSNLKFLEYAALDMAIVCSDVDSYRDVARDTENCLVVNNTGDAWYSAVKKLIDDEVYRRALASRARLEIVENFSIDKNSDVYLSTLSTSGHQ